MARAKTVTATTTFVAIIDGRYERVEAGDQRPASDAVVKANKTLFTATSATKT